MYLRSSYAHVRGILHIKKRWLVDCRVLGKLGMLHLLGHAGSLNLLKLKVYKNRYYKFCCKFAWHKSVFDIYGSDKMYKNIYLTLFTFLKVGYVYRRVSLIFFIQISFWEFQIELSFRFCVLNSELHVYIDNLFEVIFLKGSNKETKLTQKFTNLGPLCIHDCGVNMQILCAWFSILWSLPFPQYWASLLWNGQNRLRYLTCLCL